MVLGAKCYLKQFLALNTPLYVESAITDYWKKTLL